MSGILIALQLRYNNLIAVGISAVRSTDSQHHDHHFSPVSPTAGYRPLVALANFWILCVSGPCFSSTQYVIG